MKIPSLRRLFSPDFSTEYRALIDKLADSVNINFQVLYEAMNRRVSLGDNVDCVIRDVPVQVTAAGIPLGTTVFQVDDKTRALIGVQVLNVTNVTNPTVYPTGGVTVSWQQVQTGIQILHVTGLTIGNSYSLRIVGYY